MRSQRAAAPAQPSLSRRPRTRRVQLEGLEERCLLSGISAITEFTLPSGRVGNSQTGSRRAPTATSGSPNPAATRSG